MFDNESGCIGSYALLRWPNWFASLRRSGFKGGAMNGRVIRQRLRRLMSLALGSPFVPNSELVYSQVFRDSLSAHNLQTPPLYPVGGAANYSLLYAILRIVSEMPVRQVLEIGAGQSSLLLDCLAKKWPIHVVTLETNVNWAEIIGGRVSHEIKLSGLASSSIRGQVEPGFDGKIDGKFDFVIVDGPPGTKQRSRWAALEILENNLADECIVIFDDAERSGEYDTICEFRRMRPDMGVHYLYGTKSQCVLMTPRFQAAAYI